MRGASNLIHPLAGQHGSRFPAKPGISLAKHVLSTVEGRKGRKENQFGFEAAFVSLSSVSQDYFFRVIPRPRNRCQSQSADDTRKQTRNISRKCAKAQSRGRPAVVQEEELFRKRTPNHSLLTPACFSPIA